MTYKTTLGLRGLLAAGAMAVAAAMPLKAQAETTYNLALLSDFSGPYADIMPILAGGREAVFKWWNATSGKELGVTLNYKNYETRYDAAQVASLWPGIKSELDPSSPSWPPRPRLPMSIWQRVWSFTPKRTLKNSNWSRSSIPKYSRPI